MHRLTALLSLLFLTLATHAQLVPKGTLPEKVADGYKFTEGPALGPDGCIYFTDIPAELILKFEPDTEETKTVVETSGRANGLMFHKGRLFACHHRFRKVTQLDIHPEGTIFGQIMPYQFEGKQFNSPNDLTIDKHGNIYFTDPRYGNRDDMHMETEGVYFALRMFGEKGEDVPLQRIEAGLTRPNGIMLSPDESTLYVADQADNFIYAYDIVEPGKIKNKRVFARLNNGKGHGSDGMTVDKQGRLYATGHCKVWAFEPTGELVATIPVGKHTTNVTFGADGKTLYITANKGLYRMTLNTDAPLEHTKQE